jgi:hypothetical protein
MPAQVILTYKAKFAQQLQIIQESHSNYVKANRELLATSREAIKNLFNQMRQWLLPFAMSGLLHVRLETIVCFKEILGDFDTHRLIIKLSDNRSIVVEPFALSATVACSNVRMTFARSAQDIKLAWSPTTQWRFKGHPFDGLSFNEELFFACLGEFAVLREDTIEFW